MGDWERKSIVVLGSTGSVGRQTLDVVRAMRDRFRVVGLSGHSQWDVLARQIKEFGAEVAAVTNGTDTGRLVDELNGHDVELLTGQEGLRRLAGWDGVDVVVSAVSGNAGLPAAVAALQSGTTLALANKEAVVMGGPLLAELAAESGATILPVDSEHSALFQLLAAVDPAEVSKIILTASGGPFYGRRSEDLAQVSPEEALRHPVWQMGKKITVDSATLMNKALEVIEARWLFDVPPDRISVLIHPQSVVHCLVELADGSVLAHMGAPDMRLPIKYALTYPARVPGAVKPLDLAQVGMLEFYEPDFDAFPALGLGYRVARAAGTSGAVMSAANEEAVSAFLAGRARFTDIVRLVEMVLDAHDVRANPGLDDLMAADRWAREEAARCLEQL
jgi:1-deoxy-D-xylulose-5-phosphate reductoisomerase